jgi:transcriptional regulator with XRE-family HTH domain
MMVYYGTRSRTCQYNFGIFMGTIGSRLREERERLKLSQPAFGELGGVQKQAQLKYEKDDRSPDATYLSAIAMAGADVLYILTGIRGENVAHTPTEMGYLRHCRLLATKNLESEGLKGLVFLRESNGIKLEDMPDIYQTTT